MYFPRRGKSVFQQKSYDAGPRQGYLGEKRKKEKNTLVESSSKLYGSQRFQRSLRKMEWRFLEHWGTLILPDICQRPYLFILDSMHSFEFVQQNRIIVSLFFFFLLYFVLFCFFKN